MSQNSKLPGALLIVLAVLFSAVDTANAQPGHRHSGGHATADHPRVGSRENPNTNHDRVGSRENPSNNHYRVGSRESQSTNHDRAGGEVRHNHGGGHQNTGNFQPILATPTFQPMYRPISSFNPAPNYNRGYDDHRDDDDRDAKRISRPNPGIGMWWPLIPVVPNRRAQRLANAKARAAAAKPVAAVVKKPIVDLPEPELRTWTDDTGRYTTFARFVGMLNQNVTLLKLDNSQVELPFDRLSVADQEWIESRRSAQ